MKKILLFLCLLPMSIAGAIAGISHPSFSYNGHMEKATDVIHTDRPKMSRNNAPGDTKWILLGEVEWEDPFWNFDGSTSVKATVERSASSPYTFRIPAYTREEAGGIIIHCENPQKAYVEPYSLKNQNGEWMTVVQICEENGWRDISSNESGVSLYGTFDKDKGIFSLPGDYFLYIENDNVDSRKRCSSDRKAKLTLPKDYDQPIESGIYFGITAFNYLPEIIPMGLLTTSNKYDYKNFVLSRETDDATYLYYSAVMAMNELASHKYPADLSSIAMITFTDGNDDGSLKMATDKTWNDIDFQNYIKGMIQDVRIQGDTIQAFSIGLKGKDVNNDALFRSNLDVLASHKTKATEVKDISGVEQTLNDILNQLEKSWETRKVICNINMRGHGDILRFTLDKTRDEMLDPEDSEIWIEGIFSREDNSLNNIKYYGCQSSSGSKAIAKEIEIGKKSKYQFVFENLTDLQGNILDVKDVLFWHKTEANPEIWIPHTESDGSNDLKTQTERKSAAIMFVMDCSTSLGEDFINLQQVVLDLIDRLAPDPSQPDEPDNPNSEVPDDQNPNVSVQSSFDEMDYVYLNLQGIPVSKPTKGLYILRRGNKTTKVYVE